MENHKLQIGVMGSWRTCLEESSFRLAEEIGKEIARRGYILVTGGSTGVMEHSMKGCKSIEGTTVGIIAAQDYRKYPHLGKYIDVKISTGMGESGRIPILVNSCDGVIAIGGGAGTLTEIGHAYHIGKPIVVMENSGSVCDKVRALVDEEGYLDSKKLVRIQFAQTAKEAIDKLVKEIRNGESRGSEFYGPEHGKRA